ncbi:hypothetical protein FQN54_005117 [Arachnomyces sp. PD_36]|nr:hypothetical protein FQN54_005117 [Arachnomyces sp. PD_36]
MTSPPSLNTPVGVPGHLSTIPPEIALWIGGYLDLYDLHSLIRTGRRLYSLFSPRFYKLALSHEKDENNPLIWAVRNGHLSVVQKLLAQEVYEKHAYRTRLILGTTSIHEAVIHRNDDALRLLLPHRAFISLRNSHRETPLMVAVGCNNIAAIRILLDAGAGMDHRPLQQWSRAVHKAGCEGSEGALQVLLDNAVSKGWVPQDSTYKNMLGAVARRGRSSMIRLLCDRGYDIQSGLAFHEACCNGNMETVEIFLEQGTDVNIRHLDDTVLYMLASGENVELVRYLVDHGAAVNAVCKDNNTPLHEAVAEGTVEMVKYLLSAGANFAAENGQGHTPLHHLVAKRTDVALVEDRITALVEAGADINQGPRTPLHLAAKQGRRGMVDILLKLGADVNRMDDEGSTPLLDAVYGATSCTAAVVELLLDAGADAWCEDNTKHTPLIRAASLGLVDVFQKLLALYKANNMNYLKRCDCGQSVLEAAADHGHTAILETALDQPEDLNGTPDGKPYWMPALHQAIASGQAETAEWLLTHGANPHILDRYGRSALDWGRLNEEMSTMMTKHCPEDRSTNPHKQELILRESVSLLAARLLEDPKNERYFYKLGKCLIFLDDLVTARAPLAQCPVSCSLCKRGLPPADGRFTCLSCSGTDFCAGCMEVYVDEDPEEYVDEDLQVGVCEGHEFIEILPSDGEVLGSEEAKKPWLEDLMAKYTVSREDLGEDAHFP